MPPPPARPSTSRPRRARRRDETMSEATVTGSCLCGAVHYEVRGTAIAVWHCHCLMCRKQHGAAFATYALYPFDRFQVMAGTETLRSYRSSAEVERRFCSTCGSSLFWEHLGAATGVWVAAGTLDGDPGRAPQGHIFSEPQVSWHTILDDLPRYE